MVRVGNWSGESGTRVGCLNEIMPKLHVTILRSGEEEVGCVPRFCCVEVWDSSYYSELIFWQDICLMQRVDEFRRSIRGTLCLV